MTISGVALSGLNQAQTTLENVAKRINGASEPGDSVELSTDAVSLIQAKNDFEAILKAVRVADELDKSAIGLLG